MFLIGKAIKKRIRNIAQSLFFSDRANDPHQGGSDGFQIGPRSRVSSSTLIVACSSLLRERVYLVVA
jgi:hypothetical protein